MKKTDILFDSAISAIARKEFLEAERYVRKAIVLSAFSRDRSGLQNLFHCLCKCLQEQNQTEEAKRIAFLAQGFFEASRL